MKEDCAVVGPSMEIFFGARLDTCNQKAPPCPLRSTASRERECCATFWVVTYMQQLSIIILIPKCVVFIGYIPKKNLKFHGIVIK